MGNEVVYVEEWFIYCFNSNLIGLVYWIGKIYKVLKDFENFGG